MLRHQGDLGFSYYEGQIKLDQYRAKKRKGQAENSSSPLKAAKCQVSFSTSSLKAPNVVVLDGDDHVHVIASDESDIEIVEKEPEKELIRSKIMEKFPNLFEKSEMCLKTPPTDLLPFRVWPKKSSYVVKVQDNAGLKFGFVVPAVVNPEPHQPQEVEVNDDEIVVVQSILNNHSAKSHRKLYRQYVQPNRKGKRSKGQKVKNSTGKNLKWQIFRQMQAKTQMPEIVTLSDDDGEDSCSDFNLSSSLLEGPLQTLWPGFSSALLEGPLHTLWTGSSVPLIRPSQASSTKSILSKLNLKPFEPQEAGRKMKISFDIYGPNVHFRKSSPRLPNFRLVVVTSEESLPTKADLKATLGTIKDKVPLLFAIVSQSDVSMFNLFPVDLPTEITMG